MPGARANGFAWGPGVGDDKATVMEVIYGLAALKEAGFDDYKEIIYYTNAEEEGGSPTAEGIVAELSQQADFAVIMDVARPNWGAGRFCRYYGRCTPELGHCNPAQRQRQI